MKEQQEYSDELKLLKKEVNEQNNLDKNAYKDLNFRYYFFLDFLLLQLVCLILSLFMLGIRDIFGEKYLQEIFDKFWYLLFIPIGTTILEIILVYLFYKKIIMLGKPWVILWLYFLFIGSLGFIAFLSCLNSVITCIFFEGLVTLNVLSFTIMNSIKAMEDKNIIKIFVIYINTFTVIIVYIVLINKTYVVFFILATSSVLYFSYMINNYKRLILINFPLIKYVNINEKNEDSEASDESQSDSFYLNSEESLEKEILGKMSIWDLTKISFIASFADTTVFNFS